MTNVTQVSSTDLGLKSRSVCLRSLLVPKRLEALEQRGSAPGSLVTFRQNGKLFLLPLPLFCLWDQAALSLVPHFTWIDGGRETEDEERVAGRLAGAPCFLVTALSAWPSCGFFF